MRWRNALRLGVTSPGCIAEKRVDALRPLHMFRADLPLPDAHLPGLHRQMQPLFSLVQGLLAFPQLFVGGRQFLRLCLALQLFRLCSWSRSFASRRACWDWLRSTA